MAHYADGVLQVQDRYGSLAAERELIWANYHQHILHILGAGGGTIPMGDPNHENPPDLTAVTCMGAAVPVFTYKPGARTAFPTPMYHHSGPGQIPIFTFDGAQYLESPDASMWSHLDWAGTNGFAFVFWANVTSTIPGSSRVLFSKYKTPNEEEYVFELDSSDKLRCTMYDSTVGVNCYRQSDAVAVHGAMTMFAVTYAGIGGGSAANYITLYENGDIKASSSTNDGSYVGMRNQTAKPMVGRRDASPARGFIGEIAGGPFGPFWTKDNHSAATMRQLYHLGRSAMAL